MEARWANQGYIHFKTNHTDGLLLFAVKDSLNDNVYMYLRNDTVYICEDTIIAGNLDVGVGATSSKLILIVINKVIQQLLNYTANRHG